MSKFGSISALWGTVDNTRSCLRYKTSALRSKHFALLGYSYGLNLGWQTDIRQISCPCVPFFFFKTNNVLLKQYFISVYVFYLFGVLLFFLCECVIAFVQLLGSHSALTSCWTVLVTWTIKVTFFCSQRADQSQS